MKLLVLDGNSIINRAFYGVRPLTTKDGQPTNAVYGFLTMLEKMRADTRPDAIAVAFDMRAPTFRHIKYSGYKAKRKGMPEELAAQMQPLKDLLTALGLRIITAEGWEADDILGTLAESCRRSGDECVIATGDRDTLQLIGSGVTVRLLSSHNGRAEAVIYDEDAIMKKYGVTPRQLIDIKAIQGDSSDNIPGVPGIGEKGAGELRKKFGSLDSVYENIDDPTIKAGMRTKLENGKDSAYLSYWLGTVQTDAPVPLEPSEYIPKEPDYAEVRRMMISLELFSLMERMKIPASAQSAEPKNEEPSEKKAFSVGFCNADEAIKSACDAKCAGIVMCPSGAAALCIGESVSVVQADEASVFLKKIWSDESIKKRTHDIKALDKLMRSFGCTQPPAGFTMDTMLAAYLVNPTANDYSLERLAAQYSEPCDDLPPFLADAACAVRFPSVADALEKAVEKNGVGSLLRDMEIPLAIVLSDMEEAGFATDAKGIEDFAVRLSDRIELLVGDIYETVGYEFNLNSPKQMGQALFEKLMLPGGKKTKTGYSTSAEVLEGLRGQHEVIDNILEYRSLSKLHSTYCVGLLKEIKPDGRIHTSFKQTETRTGRISSTEPNLQNIPVRTELGREMRGFFVAAPGKVLIDADYSQIELRVLAHIAGDKTMIDAFRNNADIHTITAAQVFGVEPDAVTPQMRSNAKAVNFGIVYGISAFSLAKDIGVSRADADAYIKGYMNRYKAVSDYMKRVVEEAKLNGCAQTLYGRKRPLPELASSNFNMRSFGERVARNMPIQGTAADIIKLAMVRVFVRLRRENIDARLIMKVQDDLIVEAAEADAEKALSILIEEMTNAASLDVPLLVDAHIGKTWLEAKG